MNNTQRQLHKAMANMAHLQGPFGCEATMSSDSHNIRVINADLGEGKSYAAIASIRDRLELTQEENLATAEMFRSAPEMRMAILAYLDSTVDRKKADQMLRASVGLD